MLGYVLALLVVLLFVPAIAGVLGRRRVGPSALLPVLVVVQAVLPSLRASVPWVAALHPVKRSRCWA
jgi:putative effector of murein hydrolase LrgA (UPF0299 family)